MMRVTQKFTKLHKRFALPQMRGHRVLDSEKAALLVDQPGKGSNHNGLSISTCLSLEWVVPAIRRIHTASPTIQRVHRTPRGTRDAEVKPSYQPAPDVNLQCHDCVGAVQVVHGNVLPRAEAVRGIRSCVVGTGKRLERPCTRNANVPDSTTQLSAAGISFPEAEEIGRDVLATHKLLRRTVEVRGQPSWGGQRRRHLNKTTRMVGRVLLRVDLDIPEVLSAEDLASGNLLEPTIEKMAGAATLRSSSKGHIAIGPVDMPGRSGGEHGDFLHLLRDLKQLLEVVTRQVAEVNTSWMSRSTGTSVSSK